MLVWFGSGYSEVTDNYDAPTLVEMRERLGRALRDENGKSFNSDDLNDYIKSAMVEISAIYPREVTETFDLIDGIRAYPTSATNIFRVEFLRNDVVQFEVESGIGDVQNGYDLHARNLYIPPWLDYSELTDALTVWGYAPRFAPGGALGDDQPLDVDAVAEDAVRHFVMLEAYQSLVNDRSRFAQWNAIPSNTDVTMPQIEAIVSSYQQRWDDKRRRLRRLRRVG